MITRPRGWLAIFVALVFTAGVGTGLLLQGYLEETPAASSPVSDGPRPAAALVIPRLAGDLNLTAEQQGQLQRILEARRARLLQGRRQMRGHVGNEIVGVIEEIGTILTPEQQERFAPIMERIRARLNAESVEDLPR